jgi:hypothetical protein
MGVSPFTDARNPPEPADLKINLLLKNFTNTLHKLICLPTLSRMKSNTTMNSNENSDESSSCLARVDIAPPKLNLQWKGFSQNPNENVGYKSTQ